MNKKARTSPHSRAVFQAQFKFGLYSFLIAFVVGTSSSLAATIERIEGEHCVVSISGQIEKGDLDRLSALDAFNGYVKPRAVCLDSPGGSLQEAIDISKYLREHFIGTYVGSDSQCLSACAILFMFGTAPLEIGLAPDRTMHVNARIGFHRPALPVAEGGALGSRDIEHTYDLAMETVWAYFQLANERVLTESFEPAFPPDLFEEMLARSGPQTFFFLDTMEEVVTWHVRLDGLEIPEQIGSDALFNLCNNFIGSRWGGWFDAPDQREFGLRLGHPPIILSDHSVEGTRESFLFRVQSPFTVEDWPLICTLRYNSGNPPGRIPNYICTDQALVLVGAKADQTCAKDITRMSSFDPRLVFPFGTRIADANAVARRLATSGPPIPAEENPNAVGTSHAENALSLRCAPSGSSLSVVNVNEFATLRATASFDARVVARASLGDLLSYSGAINIAGSGPLQRCRDLCVAAQHGPLGETDRREFEGCFENNLIWYKVRNASGRTGWVNGKYLNDAE